VPSDLKRKANNAAGICIIAGVFTVEVSFMHSKMPNAATPWVLGVLGLTALGALVAACRWNLQAKEQGNAHARAQAGGQA
jgi:hypothetical protein